MKWCRLILLPLAASAAMVATIISLRTPCFETSLESLVDQKSLFLPEPISRSVSSRVQAVSSSESFEEAFALAEKFVEGINTNSMRCINFRVEGAEFPGILGFYLKNRAGLISDRDLEAISGTNSAEKILASIASPTPSLFPFDDDPYRFLDGYVKKRPCGMGAWRLKNGVLSAFADGRHHVLVSLALFEDVACDIKRLPALMAPLVAHCRRLNARSSNAEISLSGAPVHTFETSSRCEWQISLLSAFSAIFVVLLVVIVIRSVKAVMLVAANLVLAVSAGFSLLILLFDSIHLLSMVFGTTLIGLTVDYVLHSVLSAKDGDLGEIRSNLAKSYATTLVSMMPLLFSGIGILVQSAVFLMSGLTASLLFNLRIAGVDVANRGDFAFFRLRHFNLPGVLPVIVALAFAGIFVADFKTGVADIYSPADELRKSEALVAKLSGVEPDSGMVVVKGGNLEEILEKEERFGFGGISLSSFVPSFAKRRQNHRSIMDFHEKNSTAISKFLGLDDALPIPPSPKVLTVADLPDSIAQRFLFKGEGAQIMSLIPCVPRQAADRLRGNGDDVSFYAPREMLDRMLFKYGEKAFWLLCASFALLVMMLSIFYRGRFWMVILPPLLAVMTMFAVVSFGGKNLNLFHLLASFMIIGMSLDYSIFLREDFNRSFKAVFCALLTSVAGFGALAFVSFPIIRSLGIAMGIGLPISFLAAIALFAPRKQSDERAATALGMEIMWLIYRAFGKRALDLLSVLVADIVWMSDPKARKTARTRKRLVNFALSLADKITVLSMGRGQPAIRLDQSGDANRFIDEVARRKGVVVVSSHLGNIEALAAYGECKAKFHVFMSLSATGVFRAFKERHSCRSMIELHPTEGFSMAELFAGSAMVDKGDVVLIAGDRGGGRVRIMPFMGGKRKFPEGAFRFAAHLERPVYFVCALREKSGYCVYAKELSRSDLLGDYVRELERLVVQYPDQWYQWDDERGENG